MNAQNTAAPADVALDTWTFRGNLRRMVDELERQKQSRLDVVIDGRDMRVDAVGPGVLQLVPHTPRATEWLDAAGTPMTARVLGQYVERMNPKIPIKFFRELAQVMPAKAATLATDVLHHAPKRHFVRMLDKRVRAFLSGKYRAIDNFDLAFTALDVATKVDAMPLECSLSETNMRMKLISKNLWDEVAAERDLNPSGHKWFGQTGNQRFLRNALGLAETELPAGPGTVYPVVTISNSETGHGGLTVQIGLLRALCSNLAAIETGVAMIHAGARNESLGIYSAETIALESKTYVSKATDAIKAAFHPAKFAELVAKANKAQEQKIEAPSDAVDNVAKVLTLSEDRKKALLNHFYAAQNPSRYGMAQAVSRLSQDVENPDDAFELERAAGKLIADEKYVALA